jgi:hypothetical protein
MQATSEELFDVMFSIPSVPYQILVFGEVLGSNLGPAIFHGFPRSLKVNTVIVPPLSDDCLVPNPLKCIIHPSSYHSTLHSLATVSVVK